MPLDAASFGFQAAINNGGRGITTLRMHRSLEFSWFPAELTSFRNAPAVDSKATAARSRPDDEILLSVVVTVVSGKRAVEANLRLLCEQVDFAEAEIIVPFDKWSSEIADLKAEFPDVTFHFIEDLGQARSEKISSHQHRLFDRRRAVGLSIARGSIIAMIEDRGRPAEDWVRQIIAAHEQPYPAIGGAVENSVDEPISRAVYFCDFGRYGRPFAPGPVNYISDVNVSYKREALERIRSVWDEAYHETTVHWEMLAKGQTLYLDDRPVVFQERPQLTFFRAVGERVQWGRIFAETRASRSGVFFRAMYALGVPFLPPVLLYRAFRNMRRQRLSAGKTLATVPVAFGLLCGWACGEFAGYCVGSPK